jgi:hypothetical protein
VQPSIPGGFDAGISGEQTVTERAVHDVTLAPRERKEIMTIITLITLFATLTATRSQPSDLCDIVYADTGRPVF